MRKGIRFQNIFTALTLLMVLFSPHISAAETDLVKKCNNKNTAYGECESKTSSFLCKSFRKKLSNPLLKNLAVDPIDERMGGTLIYKVDIDNDSDVDDVVISSGSQEAQIEISTSTGERYAQLFSERVHPIRIGNKNYLLAGHNSNTWKTLNGVSVLLFENGVFKTICDY